MPKLSKYREQILSQEQDQFQRAADLKNLSSNIEEAKLPESDVTGNVLNVAQNFIKLYGVAQKEIDENIAFTKFTSIHQEMKLRFNAIKSLDTAEARKQLDDTKYYYNSLKKLQDSIKDLPTVIKRKTTKQFEAAYGQAIFLAEKDFLKNEKRFRDKVGKYYLNSLQDSYARSEEKGNEISTLSGTVPGIKENEIDTAIIKGRVDRAADNNNVVALDNTVNAIKNKGKKADKEILAYAIKKLNPTIKRNNTEWKNSVTDLDNSENLDKFFKSSFRSGDSNKIALAEATIDLFRGQLTKGNTNPSHADLEKISAAAKKTGLHEDEIEGITRNLTSALRNPDVYNIIAKDPDAYNNLTLDQRRDLGLPSVSDSDLTTLSEVAKKNPDEIDAAIISKSKERGISPEQTWSYLIRHMKNNIKPGDDAGKQLIAMYATEKLNKLPLNVSIDQFLAYQGKNKLNPADMPDIRNEIELSEEILGRPDSEALVQTVTYEEHVKLSLAGADTRHEDYRDELIEAVDIRVGASGYLDQVWDWAFGSTKPSFIYQADWDAMSNEEKNNVNNTYDDLSTVNSYDKEFLDSESIRLIDEGAEIFTAENDKGNIGAFLQINPYNIVPVKNADGSNREVPHHFLTAGDNGVTRQGVNFNKLNRNLTASFTTAMAKNPKIRPLLRAGVLSPIKTDTTARKITQQFMRNTYTMNVDGRPEQVSTKRFFQHSLVKAGLNPQLYPLLISQYANESNWERVKANKWVPVGNVEIGGFAQLTRQNYDRFKKEHNLDAMKREDSVIIMAAILRENINVGIKHLKDAGEEGNPEGAYAVLRTALARYNAGSGFGPETTKKGLKREGSTGALETRGYTTGNLVLFNPSASEVDVSLGLSKKASKDEYLKDSKRLKRDLAKFIGIYQGMYGSGISLKDFQSQVVGKKAEGLLNGK